MAEFVTQPSRNHKNKLAPVQVSLCAQFLPARYRAYKETLREKGLYKGRVWYLTNWWVAIKDNAAVLSRVGGLTSDFQLNVKLQMFMKHLEML